MIRIIDLSNTNGRGFLILGCFSCHIFSKICFSCNYDYDPLLDKPFYPLNRESQAKNRGNLKYGLGTRQARTIAVKYLITLAAIVAVMAACSIFV